MLRIADAFVLFVYKNAAAAAVVAVAASTTATAVQIGKQGQVTAAAAKSHRCSLQYFNNLIR